MPDVTTIPTELWREITTTACTDGGFTGRSLALTNRFFHAQSLSTRFHSLSFTSVTRAEDFLAFVDNQPKECRPKIEHLYLVFFEEIEPAKPHPTTWEQQQKQDETVAAEKEKWDERFVRAMTRLFALAGRDLRTLCMLERWELPLPPFPFQPLPKLKELTLLGGYELFMPEPPAREASVAPASTFKLPSLQRLHFLDLSYKTPFDLLTDIVVKQAPPLLTHLRVSGIGAPHSRFTRDLGRFLGVRVRTHESEDDASPPKLAAALRHVVIHGNSPSDYVWWCNDDYTWSIMCSELEAIASEVWETRGVEMVLISRPWRRNPCWADRLYNDWVDRIEGGKGCWVSSEEEEEQLEVYEDDEDDDTDDDL